MGSETNNQSVQSDVSNNELELSYRPPFAWAQCHQFLQQRTIEGLEWTDRKSYSRTIRYKETKGYFSIENRENENRLLVKLQIDSSKNLEEIKQKLGFLYDVDAPIDLIDEHVIKSLGSSLNYQKGLRIPGIWSIFEAGMRAILGQQVTVAQAKRLVTLLVDNLGEDLLIDGQQKRKLFPEPNQIYDNPLDFFKMPQARKDTVRRLAEYFLECDDPSDVDAWLELKGIGPWTANYVKLRAIKVPDIWLAGDAGIKNALKKMDSSFDANTAKPWRSYLTFQLWHQLSKTND